MGERGFHTAEAAGSNPAPPTIATGVAQGAGDPLIVGIFFNDGGRAFDLSDPFRPTEAA